MNACFVRAAVLLAALSVCASLPGVAQHKARGARAASSDPKVASFATVAAFESAYRRQDKNAMLLRLMVPSTDNAVLEKRYQWLRGYGPDDMPGSKHPPILFETTRGTFVPTSYSILKSAPIDAGHYSITVREEGTYHDEDGRFHVMRVRQVKTTRYKGKWYVMDYFLEESPDDYGFFVDNIVDRMTKL